MKKQKIIYILFFLYIVLYLFINTKGLNIFPFIHSDEPWLSGLTRQIMDKNSFKTTESFFDIYPRNPHSIKIIFHYIQSFFVQILGYNIFSLRLFSVLTGLFSIIIFFITLTYIEKDKSLLPLIYTIFFSLNIQFIYASRFARQEIQILLFLLIVNMLIFLALKSKKHSSLIFILIAITIGLSIGFHPNSFILAVSYGFISLYLVLSKKLKLKVFLKSIVIIVIFALIFIFISFKLNPNFINDYLEFGKTLNVNASSFDRIKNFGYFYIKLWNQISITYYIPNLKSIFLILISLIISSPLVNKLMTNKHLTYFNIELIMIIGINFSYFLIGRFSPLSIVFLMPSIYIMTYLISSSLSNINIRNFSIFIIGTITILSSFHNLKDINYENYNDYLLNLKKYVEPSDIVLCNLNGEYAFNNTQMFDYRNLDYLKINSLSFNDYVEKNNITKIIISEEMDYIYRNTPKWNYLYGDVSYYYEDLKYLLAENCIEIGNFDSRTYGNRIVRYMGDYPWKVKIYKIK